MLLAYLDPGTGSIILQALIAGVMGAMFAIKLFWSKIVHGFRAVFSRGPKDDDANG